VELVSFSLSLVRKPEWEEDQEWGVQYLFEIKFEIIIKRKTIILQTKFQRRYYLYFKMGDQNVKLFVIMRQYYTYYKQTRETHLKAQYS